MEKIKKIRGFQDIYGSDVKKYRYISNTARKIFELYNFEEIILPYLEDINLFKRSVGEATDIVQKEMYDFVDKGGRHIALRPEGTASVVRAYIEENMQSQGGYKKLFYEGAMFRYERPQAGRYRQFHQIGAEIFGLDTPLSDAELIKMAKDILDNLNIDAKLEINCLGKFEDRANYIKNLKNFLMEKKQKLCETCQTRIETNPLRVLDCKVPTCKEETSNAPTIVEYLSDESLERYELVKEYLNILNVNFKENPKLVRGLDYYTDIVFEFISDNIGAQSTICAGGRYDKLVEQLGGKPTPALGFALGVERIMLLIDKIPEESPIVAILSVDNKHNLSSLKLASKIRKENIKVELILKEGSLKSKMKLANKIGAKFVVFVSDTYELKDMQTGQQEIFQNEQDFIDVLKEKL